MALFAVRVSGLTPEHGVGGYSWVPPENVKFSAVGLVRCGSVEAAGEACPGVARKMKQVYRAPIELVPALLAVTGILFSVTDAVLTLKVTALGGWELNPVLRFYLDMSPRVFVLSKYLFTSAGVLFFVKYQSQAIFCGLLTGRHLLVGTTLLYAAGVAYQLALLQNAF